MDEFMKVYPEKANKDGYLGAFFNSEEVDEQQLSGHNWLIAGMVEYYKLFGDKSALKNAENIFNNLYKKVLDEDNVQSIISQHKQILTDLYDERGNSKLIPLTNALQKHASENAVLRKLVKIQNNRNEALRLILSSLLHSETRNHISLIENIYELGSYKCKVKCDNQPESIDAIAKWSDKEGIIFFVCTTSSRIDHVSHVSNKKINKQEIDNILRGLKLLLKSD
jgi:uncharacterized protein YyaL (SSP411 family)